MTTEAIYNIYNYIVVFGGGIIAVILWFVYRKTHSRPLLNSIPGIFTSLGLFGTFMSIVFALGNIKESDFSNIKIPINQEESLSQEMSIEDEIDLENGVRLAEENSNRDATDNTIKIIQQLVPAFTSSILGLILALIATVLCKIVFAFEDNKIEKKMEGMTPEECLFEIMEQTFETTQILKTKEDETKLYNEQLKSNIIEQNKILKNFIQDFVDKMGGVFDNMKSSIITQVESLGKEQLTKAEEVLSSISLQLGSVTTRLLDAQQDSVRELVEKTNIQLENMAQSVAAQYELIQQNANNNMATMIDLKEQYAQSNVDILQQATNLNRQVSDNMRDSLQCFLEDVKESVNNECKSLHFSIESNVAALTRAYNFLKDRLSQITHDYEQAGLAFDNAVANCHRQNESTEKAINRTNESLSLLEETNNRLGNIMDAFNSRQYNVETLISHINEIGSAIVCLQKLETQLKRLNK